MVRCVRRDVVLGVVLESDAAEQEGDDAGHVKAVGVEVGCVRDKGDEARLDLGKSVSEARRPKAIPRAMLVLKERKNANTVEDVDSELRDWVRVSLMAIATAPFRMLSPKMTLWNFWIDLVLLENGQDRVGVRRAQR